MKYSFLLAFILSAQASAQCFGPSNCDDVYVGPGLPPVAESLLCLPDGCALVSYSEHVVRFNDRAFVFTNAYSFLPNGWPVKGWSGPCEQGAVCPDIRNQAFSDLELNAKRANRAQRYEP